MPYEERRVNVNTPVKSLPIEPGTIMEMLTLDNKMIFVGSVEWFKETTIQIIDSSGGYIPPQEYNTTVKLRFFSGPQVITLSGVIRGATENFWRLDDLKILQTEERRQHFRQYTTLSGQVMCVNALFGKETARDTEKAGTFSCRVVDLSTTGARIRTEGKFEKDDMLFLVDVRISRFEPAFTATCIVRRVIDGKEGREYGCEFYGMSADEQEFITRLVLEIQRKDLRTRRANR